MASSRDQLLQSAEKHVAKGKLDQALKDYLRVLEENPKDIATLNRVGDLYVRMNRQADSIPFFTRIADFYSKDGFFLKAIAIYKKINKIDPARLEVYERLADLYHKQGLTQDARSQYQVIADHYTKSGNTEEAVAAYKKMAAVDPNDLRIQVKLADLYRTTGQVEQAVMQYGLIGSMLLRRGAHDEAGAVFQKALELSPADGGVQKNLVRSLLAQKNPAAAIAILKAVPRTPDSLALLAEAQLDMGHRGDAARTAEQAIELESLHEGARLLLSRVRISEGSYDAALAAVAPIVESAVSGRDFGRAGNALGAILQADGAHRGTLKKLAEVREAEGNPPEAARLRLALAQEYERSGDIAAAVENYQRVLAAIPGQADARGRLAELDPSAQTAPAPPPAAVPPTAAPASRPGSLSAAPTQELEIDIEEPVAPPQPSAPARPAQPDAPVLTGEEQEIETLVVEAEVFAKYGLTDKAVERLRALVRRRPDLLPARERLVQLMQDSNNPALEQEAEALAEIYRRAGRAGDAAALLDRLGLGAAPPAAPPPSSTVQIPFDEFDLDRSAPAAPPDLPERPSAEAARSVRPVEAPPDVSPEPAREEAVPHRHATPFEPAAPMDSDFVSYEELGSLLEEEMHRGGDAPPSPSSKPAAVVEDQNLFADEQQFFNLAEELEKELADDVPPPSAPVMAGPEGEASLEEIFREFKRGVEQQLSAEDYETHFNLGIAYKEMGLVDEAIGEFQLASKDPARTVECCSMLGLCFLEKGMPQLAIKWYRKGLEAGDIEENVTVGLLYDLGCVYQSTGDVDLAYRTFLEVYGLNTNYRDVVHRVKDLEEVRRT